MSIVAAGGCGILCYFWAQQRAFMMRLAAQQALCQVMIEKNTRPQEKSDSASRAA